MLPVPRNRAWWRWRRACAGRESSRMSNPRKVWRLTAKPRCRRAAARRRRTASSRSSLARTGVPSEACQHRRHAGLAACIRDVGGSCRRVTLVAGRAFLAGRRGLGKSNRRHAASSSSRLPAALDQPASGLSAIADRDASRCDRERNDDNPRPQSRKGEATRSARHGFRSQGDPRRNAAGGTTRPQSPLWLGRRDAAGIDSSPLSADAGSTHPARAGTAPSAPG